MYFNVNKIYITMQYDMHVFYFLTAFENRAGLV